MSIPDYGGSLPKKYRGDSVGTISELGIKKLVRVVILGPSFSGKNNLVFHILKHSPHVFAHLQIIARNPHQGLRTPGDKPELVIIDDYSNDKGLQKNVFSHYFTRGRHGQMLFFDSVKGQMRYNFDTVIYIEGENN
ncbi:uncharacterized protein PITG_08272 [Phytophthora infestans T30-4]|uniref:Uncharacterized protein n=1 Tax=Phytophthora infestans (strain T30-4) TaxID=403677 RepID=D0NA77_PHYIT|nr:uncharacterized protein PITG_08272 [Phytophthora infestans T30-4]EEY54735.1 conserved hypothetical protein [Phytophthora infestans T30-4]|eukprot:XP_002903680.1 conserved hypothetical protein [Phytophthora infestans T30-4]